VALHIAVAIRLWLANRAARGSRYAVEATVEASFASRHMLLSGLLVLAFVVYHLLHFTLGAIHPSHFGHHDDQGRHDVYRMVVLGFGQPAVAASYLAAMVVLGFHLIHGIRSLFETLGAHGAGLRAVVRSLALALVVLIVGGFCTVPLSILLGLVRLSDTGGGP
jgi:succinate dehydrogenase / fumarate reductase cytochrome b subunit